MLVALSACSINSAKKNYVLAENFWSDGKYAAAVSEFEKVYAKDSTGRLGQQALYRAAMTQAFFLSQYPEAVRKLKIYAEANRNAAPGAPVSSSAWDADKLIGDLLYTKMDQYDQAIQHYQVLIARKPDAVEVPEFLFRVAKSAFFLSRFDDAIHGYRDLIAGHGASPWAERAAYEIGVTFYTRGEQRPGDRGPGVEFYEDAIEAFQDFIKKYPASTLTPEAKFGIASCLEELGQLDAAYHVYESLRKIYPAPKVVEIKLARIRERKAQRSR